MKRPFLASRKHFVSAVIGAYEGGRIYAAADLGMSLKKFDNQTLVRALTGSQSERRGAATPHRPAKETHHANAKTDRTDCFATGRRAMTVFLLLYAPKPVQRVSGRRSGSLGRLALQHA
jgi:hypothetical protein